MEQMLQETSSMKLLQQKQKNKRKKQYMIQEIKLSILWKKVSKALTRKLLQTNSSNNNTDDATYGYKVNYLNLKVKTHMKDACIKLLSIYLILTF